MAKMSKIYLIKHFYFSTVHPDVQYMLEAHNEMFGQIHITGKGDRIKKKPRVFKERII